MRWLLLVLSLFASSVWASAMPVSLPSNLTSVAGGIATNGAVSLSGGSAAVTLTTQVEGQLVRIPAVMRMAANAGQIGIAAMRVNPWGIVATSVLSMLVSYGIQKCVDGTWCTSAKPAGSTDAGFNGFLWVASNSYQQGLTYPSPQAVCQGAATAFQAASSGYTYTVVGVTMNADGASGQCNLAVKANDGSWSGSAGTSVYQTGSCVSGYVPSGSWCVPDQNAQKVPAGDADWARVPTTGWPDQVMNDLAASGVKLPVTVTPSVDHVDTPLGSPVTDPVTGNRYQNNARVTPNASDPRTADLTVTKQLVDANGNPVVDATTGAPKAPEKQDDPCTGHETRLGCTEQGEVPQSPDLKEQQINVSITPDGGWGADNATCPADIPFTAMGRTFAISWSPVCSFASMIRPLIIAMAWLAAAFIVVGAKQGGGE